MTNYEIDIAAQAICKAHEWDQSDAKLQEVRTFVTEHYDPALPLADNMVTLGGLYSKEQHRKQSAAGRAFRAMQKGHYGYREENGKLTVDELEAENVRWMFDTYQSYSEHPPASLVEAVLEEAAVAGEELSYEEAEKKVTHSAILEYITYEFTLKSEIFAYEENKAVDSLKSILAMPVPDAVSRYREIHPTTVRASAANPVPLSAKQVVPSEPIVTPETFAAVQQALKSKQMS